jgi:Terminase large subunit, T4likevirus-type, N-terminal
MSERRVGVGRRAEVTPPGRPSDDPREDVAVFAQRVLRQPLWPHQAEAACSTAFITAIAAARRTGKTTLIETLAMWTCFRERNVKAVILSATQDSARRVTEGIGQTLAASSLTRGAVVDDFATRIRLTNGSEIVSLPASQRQIRGYGKGVKLLVIDEAGFVPEELWRAAQYVALDERGSGSRIVLAGTPWGGPDLFFRRAHDAGNDGDPDHVSFSWTFRANPRLDHAYLERQRERVAPAEYAAEVLGEWGDSEGSLFPRSLLERQTADLELSSFTELDGGAMPFVGLDWGVSFDQSSAVALYRLPVEQLNRGVEPLPRFVCVPKIWPRGTHLHQTWKDVVGVRARFAALSSETNGVGAGPTQEIWRLLKAAGRSPRKWNPCATTNAKKTAAYGVVLQLLERGQLVLPREPDLLRQLAGLRFEHGERGFTRIGAESAAVHDDVCDALAIATAPYTTATARGRVVVGLLGFAQPGAVLDAQPGRRMEESEVIETGAGLRVWRRPVLQSVTDWALTFPASHRTRPKEVVHSE